MEINIEEYYKKYAPMVLRRCRFLLKDEDKALDAMQEVFMRLIINKKKLKHMYPSSLLYRIATNICLNIIKAEKSRKTVGDETIIERIASYDDPENNFIINDFINYLFKKEPASTREIAFMHYVDKMTLEEVAQESGLSVSGVRKRLRTFRSRVNYLKEAWQ